MSDKRSVTTDALKTLGTILEEGERDAIHIAVEPCEAGEDLYPAQHIGLIDGIATTKATKKLGIVDPFITGHVPKGKLFWLLVYPRQITSLRHVWEHPDFEDANMETDKKIASEEWLRDFCLSNDCPPYDEIIDAVLGKNPSMRMTEEYFHISGSDAHGSIPYEFWDHIEIVTGKKMYNRPEYFSCSC